MEDRLTIGGNNPPGMVDSANEVADAVNQWLKDNPVVETEVQARVAKVQIDRAKLCLKDLEQERAVKLAPLRQQVEGINRAYEVPRTTVSTVLGHCVSRLSDFVAAETRRREEKAEKARREAEAAKFKALEAERLEREAAENAKVGEVGVDIVKATKAADDAFDEAVAAERKAIIAHNETHVMIGGGFSRAISMRNKETLIVDDPIEAIAQIGLTDGIRDAILTSARAYRRLHGKLPSGIKIEIRQEL